MWDTVEMPMIIVILLYYWKWRTTVIADFTAGNMFNVLDRLPINSPLTAPWTDQGSDYNPDRPSKSIDGNAKEIPPRFLVPQQIQEWSAMKWKLNQCANYIRGTCVAHPWTGNWDKSNKLENGQLCLIIRGDTLCPEDLTHRTIDVVLSIGQMDHCTAASTDVGWSLSVGRLLQMVIWSRLLNHIQSFFVVSECARLLKIQGEA